jgi:hypothetical protein
LNTDLSSAVDCAQRRSAEPVDRLAAGFHRQPGEQEGHPSHIAVVVSRPIPATLNHVFDPVGIKTIAFHYFRNTKSCQVIRAHIFRDASVAADGCAHGIHDDCFLHGYAF